MNGARIMVCNVICLMTLSRVPARAEECNNVTGTKLASRLNENRALEIFPGIELLLGQDQISVNLRVRKLFGDASSLTSRKHSGGGGIWTMESLKKVGSMIMMVPMALQILSLPGALAQIKVSLIRSIFVAKLAMIVMIYNLIKTATTPPEVVVIHQPQPQPQHHQHFYKSDHELEGDHEMLGKWT